MALAAPAVACAEPPGTVSSAAFAVPAALVGAASVQGSPPTLSDTDPLRSLGFIGDGESHPLSGVARFQGMNAVGWTLAQWRAVLPAATALSDEIDWTAVQSMIDAAAGPIAIRLPISTGMMNHAIAVCANSVAFYGSGGVNYTHQGAALEFTGNTNGVNHCAGAGSKIEFHDMALNSTTRGGSLWAIADLAANYTFVENVAINNFNNCIHFVQPGGTRLLSVFCNNGQASGTAGIGEGILYEGQNSFVNHIDHALMQNYATAYDFHSTNVFPGPVGIEDLQVLNSACGGVQTCIVIRADSPNYGGFSYSFTNMSVDVTTQFIRAPNCNDLTVDGGNWLVDVPVGAWTGGQNLIDLGTATLGCHDVRLRDMWFFDAAAVSINSLLTVEAAANDVQLSGFHIEASNVAVVSNWLQAATGSFAIIERDNEWQRGFKHIAPPANAVFNNSSAPSNKFQSVTLGPPSLSACGANPSLSASADSSEGVITEGSGSPTGCTLTFARPNRALAPDCELFNTKGAYPLTLTAASVVALAYTHAPGSMVVHYRCRAW